MDENNVLETMINKDIMNVITMMKKCHSKSIYDILIADLSLLYNLGNKLGIDNMHDVDDYCFKYFEDNERKNINKICSKIDEKIEFYDEITENYLELFRKYDIDKNDLSLVEGSLKNYINIKDSIDLTLEFLEKYNFILYKKCIELINDNRVIYIPSRKLVDDYGLTYYGFTNFNPYLIISDTNTLEASTSFIHEMGHVYDKELSKNTSYKLRINKQYNDTEEVYSHYLELLFYDFLEEKKIFKEDINKVKKIYDINLSGSFDNLNELLELIKNDGVYTLDNLRSIPEYALGMMLAYHFYDMYLNNNKEGKSNIESFLLYSNIMDTREIINEFGLDEEKIISGKVIEKHLKKNWK